MCSKLIDSVYNCAYLAKHKFYNGLNNEHCIRDCPIECEKVEYDKTVFYSSFPSEGYQQLLNARLKASERNPKGIVAIKVFYKNSNLNTNIEVPAMTASTFISQIGGIFG